MPYKFSNRQDTYIGSADVPASGAWGYLSPHYDSKKDWSASYEDLTPAETDIVKKAIEEFKKYYKTTTKNHKLDDKGLRMLVSTLGFLRYTGSSSTKMYLIPFVNEYEKLGATYIPQALRIRYKQAVDNEQRPTDKVEIPRPDPDDIIVDFEEEESPVTQRSAKVLNFANVFYKLARG